MSGSVQHTVNSGWFGKSQALNISSTSTDTYIYFLTPTSFFPGAEAKELSSYYNDGHIAGNLIMRITCQCYPAYKKAKASDIKSRTEH